MQTPQLIQDEHGTKRWYLDDKRHREDGPAIEYSNGSKCWYLHGKLHREDGPAVEYADGTKEWYLHDKVHREDGPAVEYADGRRRWFLNGKELERFPLSLNKKKVGDLIFITKQPAIITHVGFFVKVFMNNQEIVYFAPT